MKLTHILTIGTMGSALLLVGCFDTQSNTTPNPDAIATGDTVTVSYTMKWSDGKIFSTNKTGAKTTGISSRSLDRRIQETFVAGEDNAIWGKAVVGKKKNDKITNKVNPATSKTVRQYDRNKVQNITKSSLGAAALPSVGDVYEIAGQIGYIKSLSGSGKDQIISIDLNPRETRDTYTYELTISDINKK